MKWGFSNILILIGLLLIGVNLLGLSVSIRDTQIYSMESEIDEGIRLDQHDVLEIIGSRGGPIEDYLIEANDAVNRGVLHYWPNNRSDDIDLRIPFHENYLLNLASYFIPQHYSPYELCDHHKALERGVGLCSQQAIILAGFLNENSIQANPIQLSGHFVVQADINETSQWVLDPDFGVVIKKSISEIEANPDIITEPYMNQRLDEEIVNRLKDVYGHEGNVVFENGVGSWKKCKIETLSYLSIWVLPILLILAGMRLSILETIMKAKKLFSNLKQ